MLAARFLKVGVADFFATFPNVIFFEYVMTILKDFLFPKVSNSAIHLI